MTINNNLQDQLKLYANIEAHLRYAATVNKPLSLRDLKTLPDIVAIPDALKKVNSVITTLVRGRYLTVYGEARSHKYQWNLESLPFVHKRKLRLAAFKQPSEVKKPLETSVLVDQRAIEKEVELVVGGMTFLVSRNALTGRPRITIDT